MPGLAEANEPSYISSHSADVILSDIRPFKLKADALRCINVLLDEFLYNVLSSSGSLSTDRLRASLLGLLPTSLGKEALLEAEVELRAYWERSAPAGIVPSFDDDTTTFYFPWAFELLRNKCEAYSTLNEADEDPSAEGRINEKFGQSGASSFKTLLVAPAALYLTAIIEAICEHILSNVGRVAARDSSKVTASANDLFTALCEDSSVYGYFRNTKAYHQIEQLSKVPKSRRNTSVSHGRSSSVSRRSSDGSTMASVVPAPRSSFDKARALRMFANGKPSLEREDVQTGHKKSASIVSDGLKNGSLNEGDSAEDAAMQQEFDNLMRSTATVKMSLTPDRLKTMEVYKQEKEQRGNRHPTPLAFKPEPDIQTSSQTSSRGPSLRQVDSIHEDEEDSPTARQQPKDVRSRQGSVTTPPSAPFPAVNNIRTRSISTSGAGIPSVSRKVGRSPSVIVPSSFPAKAVLTASASASNLNMAYTREARPKATTGENGMPTRTRVKQRNRESLELDDIMGDSDDEAPAGPPPGLQSRAPTSPKRTVKVSSTTRELMDFLAEGPPGARGPGPVSRDGKPLLDFLADGHGANGNAIDSKPKTGRLQRMISKLNIGEKNRIVESPLKTPVRATHVGSQSPPPNPLASLANRPIPPRPPRPPQLISPPPSPSQVSLTEDKSIKPPLRKAVDFQEAYSTGEKYVPTSPSKVPSPPAPQVSKEVPSLKPNGLHPTTKGVVKLESTKEPQSVDTHVVQPKPLTTAPTVHRKPPPSPSPMAPISNTSTSAPPGPIINEADARDMHRLISNATTADECRLIVGMFLARGGITHPKPSEFVAPYPSPPPSMDKYPQGTIDSLENSVVDMLLGSSSHSHLSPSRPHRRAIRAPKSDAQAKAAPLQSDRAEKVVTPLATWKSPAEFPTHASPVIATA